MRNMLYGVRRGGLYAIGMIGLVIAGVLAWRTWPHASAGSFDPVSAVIGIASLVVGIASLILAARVQRQTDTNVAAVAARLAVAIEDEETKARRQLLGGDNRTINVRFAFQAAPGQDAAGAGRTGTLEHIVDYYRRLQPQRMVITGAAGSGKTVLAIELMLSLLNDRPTDAPVPVRISAASLDTNRPVTSAVAEWITKHLTESYKMPEAAARELVAARMVLPVLDGLDEMDSAEAPVYASRAGQAIRARNAYLDGQQKAAIILTCRISQYEALAEAREWVRDAARIQLRPVTVPAARRFLTARVTDENRWQSVLDRMQQPGNPPLAQAMSTPWRLTVAAAVYDQRDSATGRYLWNPEDLISSAMDTEERIRDHLLGLYILAAITANFSRYPAHYVHRWLGVLAEYLNANTASPPQVARVVAGRPLSGTDLILHENVAPGGNAPTPHPHCWLYMHSGAFNTHLPTHRFDVDRMAIAADPIFHFLRNRYGHWDCVRLDCLANPQPARSSADKDQVGNADARALAHVGAHVGARGRARGRARDRTYGRAHDRARARAPAGRRN